MNNIAIVLDSSGSMACLKTKALSVVNNLIAEIKSQAKRTKQKTNLSFFTFDSYVNEHFSNVPVEKVKNITSTQYRISGLTAMMDGIGLAIESLKKTSKNGSSSLLLVVTDGGENDSTIYNKTKLQKLIKEVHKTDTWTVTVQVPDETGKQWCVQHGIYADNIRIWDQTDTGLQEVQETTTVGLSAYYAARSVGQKSVKQFYTTDLSKVSTKDMNKKLKDLSSAYKLFSVPTERVIKDFVEEKVGEYKAGHAFYMLMKPEKISANKEILIMEKGKRKIWGGDNARKMIGIGVGCDAKVTPGNHANYDIYVQSTSYNRKLPRGTKILVEKET